MHTIPKYFGPQSAFEAIPAQHVHSSFHSSTDYLFLTYDNWFGYVLHLLSHFTDSATCALFLLSIPEVGSRDPFEDDRRRIRRLSLHERDLGSLFSSRPSRRDTCPKQALLPSPSESPVTSSRCSDTWPRNVRPTLTPSTTPDLTPPPASSFVSSRPGTRGAICAMDGAWWHHPAGTVLCEKPSLALLPWTLLLLYLWGLPQRQPPQFPPLPSQRSHSATGATLRINSPFSTRSATPPPVLLTLFLMLSPLPASL